MKLGSHVNNNGTKMLQGSIEEAINYKANCFMIYLGAPQNTFRKPFSSQKAFEMQEIAKQNNIDLNDIIIHAPYIVNLGRKDVEKHQFAVDFLSNELKGVYEIGCKYMVLHPGSHTDDTLEEAIDLIAQGINDIHNNTFGHNTVILLETMAGKGNEVGRNFEELSKIILKVNDKSRIGICLDTCHINDGGYDLVSNYENVISEFDKVIGIDYLKVIHLNDSKNILASHKDRHENIGFGTLGFETLHKIASDERFANIPKILETPYIPSSDKKNSYPPYKEEIAMIKSGIFCNDLKEKILNNNLK